MTLLLALLLAQTPAPPSAFTARQGKSLDGGFTAWAVECVSGCSGSGGVSSTVAISGAVGVNILDAGPPININPPGSLPLPTGAATGTKQDTGNTSLSSIDGKLPVLVSARVPVDPSGVTSPVSAASLPLPTGASIASKQPALGTAGTPSVDVLSVQGRAGMTALTVDGSGVTQPVSAASLPLPSGASTLGAQTTGNTSLSSIDTKTPALNSGRVPVLADQNGAPWSENLTQLAGTAVSVGGGNSSAGTLRVVVATDQVALPVNATITGQPLSVSLPTGAATSSLQTTGNTSLANLDVPLSTRTKPADQQHVIIDTVTPSVTVTGTVTATGPLTDTQLRATAVPVSLASAPTTAVQLPDAGTLATDATLIAGFSPTGTSELVLLRRTMELVLLEQMQQTLLLQKLAGGQPGANP